MTIRRLLRTIRRWLGLDPDVGPANDPYSRKPAPVRPGPKRRSGAVAVAEPDE